MHHGLGCVIYRSQVTITLTLTPMIVKPYLMCVLCITCTVELRLTKPGMLMHHGVVMWYVKVKSLWTWIWPLTPMIVKHCLICSCYITLHLDWQNCVCRRIIGSNLDWQNFVCRRIIGSGCDKYQNLALILTLGSFCCNPNKSKCYCLLSL